MRGMRREYEMTEAQLDKLLDACRPVPAIMLHLRGPQTQQARANAAWSALGVEMGFKSMTVRPVPGKSDRFFTAEPDEAVTA